MTSDLDFQKQNYTSKSKDMDSIKDGADKEITKLRDRLAEMDSKYQTNELQAKQKIEELKQASDKHKALYEEAHAENEKLKASLKNKDHENNVKNAGQSTELESLKKEYEAQKQIMTQNIELRDTAFNNLKKENKSFMEQVEALKQRNLELEAQVKQQPKEIPFNAQVNDLEEKLRISETNSKLVNKELKEENEKLKKELKTIQNNNKAGQDVEKEVGILSIENETLKKQVKELTAKVNNSKISADNQNAKDNEDLKKKVKDLTKSLKRIEEDYDETKVNFSFFLDNNNF